MKVSMRRYMGAGGSGSTGSDGAVTLQTEPQTFSADADETNEIDEMGVEGGRWRCVTSVEGQALLRTGGEVGCSMLLASVLKRVCQYDFQLVLFSFSTRYILVLPPTWLCTVCLY